MNHNSFYLLLLFFIAFINAQTPDIIPLSKKVGLTVDAEENVFYLQTDTTGGGTTICANAACDSGSNQTTAFTYDGTVSVISPSIKSTCLFNPLLSRIFRSCSLEIESEPAELMNLFLALVSS